jgi:hypothetical protein
MYFIKFLKESTRQEDDYRRRETVCFCQEDGYCGKKYDSGASEEEEEYKSRRNSWVFRVQGFGYSSVTGCTEEDLIRNFVSN